ncbi:MAG: hypothetical protein FWE23_03370 [Chitinivibrionia bacterium]|nr:hypothetical protein [Chitinivibrionia bacterium]
MALTKLEQLIRDRIVAENWSLPKTPGRIALENFTPYPKNPILTKFFTEIGRADILGSGVRNVAESLEKTDRVDDVILDLMKEDNVISIPNIAQKIERGITATKDRIFNLKAKGIIERIGANKGGHWKVITTARS